MKIITNKEDSIIQIEGEDKMDTRVKNFIESITDEGDTEFAITDTGVGEMNTHDVLIEIAKEFK